MLEGSLERNDLTVGPIVKKLLLFFLPVVAGTIFQQLYNTVDAFVVSKYLGTEALAAVGGTPSTVSNLIIGFCVALTSGSAVVIAQLFGAKKTEEIYTAVKTAYVFSVYVGLFVGAVVIIFTPQIVSIMQTPIEAVEGSILYQKIYFSGAVFLLIYNMGAGILRAEGDSTFPFICLFVSCVVNIVLDIFFVAVVGLGVAGVAIATIIAEFITAVMVTVKLLTMKREGGLKFKKYRFSPLLLKKMLAIGVPSGMQDSMYGVSNTIVHMGINSLGTVVVASWALSAKLDGFFWAVSGAFGATLTTFVGQNYGALKTDRIRQGAKKGYLVFLLITAGLSLLILGLSPIVFGLLTDDSEVIDTAFYIVKFLVPFYVIWTVVQIPSSVLRGLGDTVMPTVIQGVLVCLFRVAWMATVFRAVRSLMSLSVCYPISWSTTAIAMFVYYKFKTKNIVTQKE